MFITKTYLDLFAHVRSSVGTDASIYGADLANHERKTHARPSTSVSEMGEYNGGCISWCKDPEHDNDLDLLAGRMEIEIDSSLTAKKPKT